MSLKKGMKKGILFVNFVICETLQGAVEICHTCNGSGMYVRLNRIAPGMVQQIQTVCRDCGGKGEKISGWYKN
jgi:DnaJ-class molecular chaperone